MLNVNLTTGEIYLYGVVGGGFWEDGFTEADVIEALGKIGNTKAVVRINSPGGSADQGISIYNALRRHKAGVDTVVDSLAASAASVIALAGESRTSSIGSRWMIHQALTLDIGNADQLRKTAGILDKYDESIVEIYSKYLPAGTDALALMKAETWYTANEAKASGLATAVDGESDAKPTVASWFRNPPKSLVQQSFDHQRTPVCKSKLAVARNWAKIKQV